MMNKLILLVLAALLIAGAAFALPAVMQAVVTSGTPAIYVISFTANIVFVFLLPAYHVFAVKPLATSIKEQGKQISELRNYLVATDKELVRTISKVEKVENIHHHFDEMTAAVIRGVESGFGRFQHNDQGNGR